MLTKMKLLWFSLMLVQANIDLSDRFIEKLNSVQSSWKAGRNFPENTSVDYIKKLVSVLPNHKIRLPIKTHNLEGLELPFFFDARTHFKNCPSIKEVFDQGGCSSGWAVSAAQTMTDRVCIHSNGKDKFEFSVNDILSCCRTCGFGCRGGLPCSAWFHWKYQGIVSGGAYSSSIGCQPYKIAPCRHNDEGLLSPCTQVRTPRCEHRCEKGYGVSYRKDRRFGKEVYRVNSSVEQIKAEIYKNGPVQATMVVFNDFIHYKHGVYVHTHLESFPIGLQAVRIIGWGIDIIEPYWLVVNSWNSEWGDKGTFKILHAFSFTLIEDFIMAGIPKD